MSQESPYARSTSERSQHWKSTGLFVGMATAVFIAILWLIPPSLIPSWQKKPSIQTHDSSVIGEVIPETNSPEVEKNNSVDWPTQLVAIEKELPVTNNAELIQLKQQLQRVEAVLTKAKLSADAEASIRYSLNELRQHTTILKALSSRPTVEPKDLAEEITSIAHSSLTTEQSAIQQAREQAEQLIRQKMSPVIRELRLEVRDQQDKTTGLRRQIAQMQREQKEFQAKAARAEAMQREMPDIKQYLQPFTAPGNLQPKSDRNPWNVEVTSDEKPVSLARLKRLGALEDTMEGLERLYIFGGGKNPGVNNPRPLGSFPQYWALEIRKPEVLAVLKRAQKLLRDHGQALIEEQLLSP